MPRGRAIALAALAALLASGSLLVLHGELRPASALGVTLLAGGVLAAMRPVWSDLPGFVTVWLDGGVIVVATLLGTASTGLVVGLPYAVLKAPVTVPLIASGAMLGVLLGGLAWTHRRLEQRVRATTLHLTEARQLALESRLAALSAQINPHFLFNTLNTLAEVVHEDADEAEALVTDLARMMRYALEASGERVPLREEADVLTRLLRLESARLGERLRWTVEIDPEVAEARVPGLLVQPLVENAVQHAVASRVEGGTVGVRAARRDDRLVVVVSDDGPGLPEAVRDGLSVPIADASHPGGLRNAVERARLAWPDARIDVTSDPTGTTFTFDLPLERP
ncbi:MAG: histidine kinase [Alphaproteobacteria bacterium]|nr:histidine kinase [Alphaproteobacteria bacterium]